MLGEVVSGYRVTTRLGRGGWSDVWIAEATHRRDPTRVAIKFFAADISRDAAQIQRCFDDATAASALGHPGIVRVLDTGFHAEHAYLVMELLDGEPLAARLRRIGKLPLATATDLGGQLANALAATHAARITHRDLAPGSVFLVADPDAPTRDRAKLLDFGAAKLGQTGNGITAPSSAAGSAYMAPEQWNAGTPSDPRSDVYSLGCMLFELCCGRTPFIAASAGEACTQHLREPPPHLRTLLSATPRALDDLLARMLAKSPSDRPSMHDVEVSLGTLAGDLPIPTTLTIEPTRKHRAGLGVDTTLGSAAAAVTALRPRRSRLRPLATIAAVFAVAGAAGYLVLERNDPSDTATRPARPPAVSPVPAAVDAAPLDAPRDVAHADAVAK